MNDRIEASKLARGLGAVLDRVVGGETLEVIRYGRVIAVLSPPAGRPNTVQPDTARPVTPSTVKDGTRQQRLDRILNDSRKGG